MMKRLTQSQLTKAIPSLHKDWRLTHRDTKLARTFTCNNMLDGLMFAAKIVVYAQAMNHHPDIQLTHNKLKVTLTSRESGGITALDITLSKKLDSL